MDLDSRYQPDPVHLSLGEGFGDPVVPADFPQHLLRFRNDRAAARVGLDGLDDEAWLDAFGRFRPLPGNLPAPTALRYHGHQFRHYNPDLGDGRGFLLAQCRDADGHLLELGTKGSGTTRWSRGGDGRLTLQGGVREILAAELLQALGVPTSQALSLIETGEALQRHDEPSPTRSAVLVRLQGTHLRFGTVQRLAVLGERDLLMRLVEHVLATWYPEVDPGPDPAVTLFDRVVDRTASLCASWMTAGFVHGVLNTDNLTLTGESFDYGPWRFVPTFDPSFVAAYFDHDGLYAYGRQPEACQWALDRLAEALLLVGDGQALHEAAGTFLPRFQAAWQRAICARLGLAEVAPEDEQVRARSVIETLARTGLPQEALYFDAYGGAAAEARALGGPRAARWRSPELAPLAWLQDARPATHARLDHPHWQGPGHETLWNDEVVGIWRAIASSDDWAPLHAKVARIRSQAEALGHEGPPRPGR